MLLVVWNPPKRRCCCFAKQEKHLQDTKLKLNGPLNHSRKEHLCGRQQPIDDPKPRFLTRRNLQEKVNSNEESPQILNPSGQQLIGSKTCPKKKENEGAKTCAGHFEPMLAEKHKFFSSKTQVSHNCQSTSQKCPKPKLTVRTSRTSEVNL